MNAVLKGLPTEPLSAEREQELFAAGDTEKLLLHTVVPAFKYAQNARKGKVNISHAELLSICYGALSKSLKTFRPGMQSYLAYSKPFIRGAMCSHWRDQNVVRDAFRHEAPEGDEFPKPLAAEHVEPSFEEIHWREQWAYVEPFIRQLAPIEIKVLELRFKFSYTLEAAGREIGKSRERARQIEAAALHKLRAALSNRGEL